MRRPVPHVYRPAVDRVERLVALQSKEREEQVNVAERRSFEPSGVEGNDETAGLRIPKPRLAQRLRRPPKGPAVMYMAALLLFVAGGVIATEGILLNQRVKEQSQVLAAKDTGDSADTQDSMSVPSEEKPKGNYLGTYKVAPDLPRILTITSIGVKSRILQVGVSNSNELMTPRNIYDTAWYTGSAKPGENGAAIIDGHYSGPTSHGVFSKLDHLKAGDAITIERGDGKVLNFEVRQVETKKVTEVDMGKLMVSVDTNRPGLNLITCGGDYNAKSNEFNERTMIYAVLK
jgi:LPXTG-site transpeptidase (sortase) family protein